MKPIKRTIARALAAAWLVTLAASWIPNAQALPEDRDQPIEINADRAVRNEKTGVTEFVGNALLSQGSLSIAADTITINYNDNGIRDILAVGTPAVLHQIPNPEQSQVTAKANRIEYSVGDEVINLKERASIDQDGSVITSDLIRYDINQSMAEASGDNRVNIIIPPSNARTTNPPTSESDNSDAIPNDPK